MWFAPEAGGSLVRAELREFGKRMTMVRSVESHLEQFGENGVWFPRQVVRETKYNGKVTRHELVTVQEAVLGRPPDDEQFTLAGMDLLQGKQIFDRSQDPRETSLVWDGQQALAIRGPQADFRGLHPRRWTWFLVANAILLAMLGTRCLLRLRRQRGAPRNY
jgi:hypothetical protein